MDGESACPLSPGMSTAGGWGLNVGVEELPWVGDAVSSWLPRDPSS